MDKMTSRLKFDDSKEDDRKYKIKTIYNSAVYTKESERG